MPFSSAQHQLQAQHNRLTRELETDSQKFAISVAVLAGLLHDIGKATLAFQAKLNRGHGAESLRHDLVSFLILLQCAERFETDLQFLQRLAQDPQQFFGDLGWASNRNLVSVDSNCFKAAIGELENPEGRSLFEGKVQFEERPIFYSVAWLVLTHHRLPGNTVNTEACGFEEHINRIREDDAAMRDAQAKAKSMAKAHQRATLDEDSPVVEISGSGQPSPSFTIAPVEDCIRLPGKKQFGQLPWLNEDWMNKIQSCAHILLEHQAEMNGMPDTVWLQALGLQLRPVLMLADHLDASSPRDNGLMSEAAHLVLANTYPTDKGESARAGSTLVEHLIAVAENVETIMQFLFQKDRISFPQAKLKPHALIFNQNLSEKFAWQGYLSDAAVALQGENNEATFTAIMSETGAGKTLGGPRVLHALSPDGGLRYTNALGRRSLASQSALSYQRDLGLEKDELALILGTNHSSAVSAAASRFLDTLKSVAKGSESSAPDLSAEITQGSEDLSWLGALADLEVLNRYWSPKHKKLLSTPVVSGTIDHLAGAARINRSADSKLYLRLATAPLILDEIDDLQGTDSQLISRLCLVQGLNGQSVVVMSATMKPDIFAGAFRMWSIGMQYHRAMRQTKEEKEAFSKRVLSYNPDWKEGNACGNLIITSNTGKPTALPLADLGQAQKAWRKMANAHTEAVKKKTKEVGTERKLHLKVNLIPGSKHEVYQQVLDTCLETGAKNATIDPETKIAVSIGVLRVKRAKLAQRIAKKMAGNTLQVASDISLKLLNCHAKHASAHLHAIDNVLLRVCNRKRGLEYLQEPLLRAAIEEAHSEGKANLTILVVSSSIIETGKDLDFDFAVTDPISEQNLVQLAGRVGRHRQFDATYPNVVILEDQIDSLILDEPGQKSRPFAYPGVEDQATSLKITRSTPDYVKESDERYAREWNDSLSGKTGRAAYMAKHNVSSMAEIATRQKDASALPIDWLLANGINSGICLTRELPYKENKVGEASHAIAYHNHMEPDYKPELNEAPSMTNYVLRGRIFNNHQLNKTPFRGQEEERITLSMDETGQAYYYDKHDEAFVPVPCQINSQLENSRFFIKNLDHMAKQILDEFEPNQRLIVNSVQLKWEADLLLTEVHWNAQTGFSLKKVSDKKPI